MSEETQTRKRSSELDQGEDEADSGSSTKKSKNPEDELAPIDESSIQSTPGTSAAPACASAEHAATDIQDAMIEIMRGKAILAAFSSDSSDSSVSTDSESESSDEMPPLTSMGPPLSSKVVRRSETTEESPKSRRDSEPECEPGPSVPVSRLKRRLASSDGGTSDNVSIKESKFDFQSYLAHTSPFAWGRTLSDASILHSLERKTPGSSSFMAEAANMMAEAHAEPDHVARVKKYLRTAALYVVAADSLEERESAPTDAIEVYDRLRFLADEAGALLPTPVGTDPGHLRIKRLMILCWKCKAWFRYRIFAVRKAHGFIGFDASSRVPSYKLLASVESLSSHERPPTVDVPTTMLRNMERELTAFEVLHEAFRAWSDADCLIVKEAQQGFCRAVDSTMGKSVHLLSRPTIIVRYIREYIVRVDRFKDIDQKTKIL